MSFILQIRMKNIDGVLERVLGTIRYRGHQLLRLMAHPSPDGSRMDVTLKVDAGRGGTHLTRHLQKLFDVEAVECYSEVAHASYG